MKKLFFLLLMLTLLLCAACGSTAPTETAPEAAAEEVFTGGVFTFEASYLNGLYPMSYTVTLAEDGSFSVAAGDAVYHGEEWTFAEKYFTTGPVTDDILPTEDWFDPDGSCMWLVTGDGLCRPMNYVEGESPAFLTQDISYAAESPSQKLDVHLPSGEGPFPVIVLFHGGGFRFGDENMTIIQPVIDAGVANGYAVVSADYRKSGEAVFPAAVADAKAVVRWVRANAANYGFDAEHVAVWGESAGAYIAAMTALTPTVAALGAEENDAPVTALVDFYGPIEFATMDEQHLALGQSASVGIPSSFESAFLGQTVGEDAEFTAQSWWGSYVDELPADFGLNAWVQVGNADTNVPYTQSEDFAAALTELLGEENVRYGVIEGAAHEDAAFYTADNLAAVFAFLDPIMK